MLIRLQHEGDFNRLWLKELSYVDSFPMRVFRSSPGFRSEIESSIIPVWVSLLHLPFFLFNKQCLFSIGRMIGVPLTIDMATAELSRSSVAKVCIQVDLFKKLPPRVWIESGDSLPGYWQLLIYEKLLKYYKQCMRLGHDLRSCKIAHPPSPLLPKLRHQKSQWL